MEFREKTADLLVVSGVVNSLLKKIPQKVNDFFNELQHLETMKEASDYLFNTFKNIEKVTTFVVFVILYNQFSA